MSARGFGAEPEGSRFFELGLELKIGGALEAAREPNGRLDVRNPLAMPMTEKLKQISERKNLRGVVAVDRP